MPRPPYTITNHDYTIARDYIASAMTRGDISEADGYIQFRRAKTPELLQQWCDNHLNEDVFNRLKQAVRASRKRSRDYRSPRQKVSTDIDKAAHIQLASIASELSLSLSDTILKLIECYDQKG